MSMLAATVEDEPRTKASARALVALDALQAAGLHAWITGSLARNRFAARSDVDFLVDVSDDREIEAFMIIERAMGDVPFDMVPLRRLKPHAREFMMAGMIDASGLRARAP